MKKTFVALAVLAAVGSASAQVSVYGKVDLGVSNTSTSGVDQGVEVTGNNYEGSRFGVRGNHDLTGGMKVEGHFQFRVNPTGDDNFKQETRYANLAVSGGFGSLTAGLQYTPYDGAWGFDQMEYNGFSPAGAIWYEGSHGDNGTTGYGTAAKSISYSTPDMNGFNATLMYANTGGKTATEKSVPYLGLGANYATGPLSINFGYEQVASTAHNGTFDPADPSAGGAVAGEKTTAMVVGASYNLGVATIGAGYQMANATVNTAKSKDKGYTVSVSVPVSSSTTVALGYAAETTTSAGVTESKSSGFGAQAIYNWTKQAAVYGGAYQTKVDSDKTTKIAAGLRYNF
jgi:GBP family porin